MKEHPILFSGEMVQAIPEGYKTMTRRVIKPQPDFPVFVKKAVCSYDDESSYYCWWLLDSFDLTIDDCSFLRCPYGVPGDHLWAKETWGIGTQLAGGIVYRASGGRLADGEHWHPSIFMPRELSRITLEITNIRAERLQDITEEDAMKEGMARELRAALGYSPEVSEETFNLTQARDTFRILWDKLNSKRGHGWKKNDWVWVIEFKKI